ncbi:MAG TPA: hypothetical protein VM778_14250 [Gemmatimonadota bacterium]|nr:hypothetical protein [Gemmatimonadota bacterium]
MTGVPVLEALAADRRRGAAEIADRLLEWAEAWGEDDPTREPESPEAVATALARLGRSQAAMAPILRIANDLLLDLERREGTEEGVGRRAVARAASDWRRRRAAARESLVLHLRRAIGSAPTVYTYSASSTVRAAIEAHAAAGSWFRVVVSEARPGNEGAALARSLAERGVPVRLGTEAWMWGAFDEEGVFLVGADALMSAAWLNKVGTTALAGRAREAGIPVIVAADTSKYLPPALASLPRTYERDPGEIAIRPPASLEVVNPYFEEISYDLVDHLVTERGPTRPRDLRTGEIPVAKALR